MKDITLKVYNTDCFLSPKHCNPNDLENFDHLSTNDSGNDDRSKWAIGIILNLYLNSR